MIVTPLCLSSFPVCKLDDDLDNSVFISELWKGNTEVAFYFLNSGLLQTEFCPEHCSQVTVHSELLLL